MPNYIYKAVGENGKKISGELYAANEGDLQDKLSGQDLTLLSTRKKSKYGSIFARSAKPKDLVLMCVQLEQLDRAGVPILEAIADVRDSTESKALKNSLINVHNLVKSGESLSGAFAKQDGVFDEVFVGLISVGERTGNFKEAFSQLSEHYKWVGVLRTKIKKALRYPAVMLVIMGIIISIMMVKVVPQLTDFLQNIGIDLPLITRALISTSNFFKESGLILLVIIIATVILIKVLYRLSDLARYFLDSIILSLPVIGQVVLKLNLSRFCHFFSLTFNSGVDMLKCIDSGAMVVNNVVLKKSVMKVKDKVSSGVSLTTSMESSGMFPNLVLRMFKVGEDSGNVEEALENVCHFYDKEVENDVEIMVGLIQPTLIVVVGAILAWIMIAVFGPLYANLGKMIDI